jgi:WD40 repeat protein
MSVHSLRAAAHRIGSIAIALGLIVCLAGPAHAGPVGAIGDVYVSDGDVGGIFQYDGATGAPVGLFASRGARTFMANAWGPDGNLYAVTTVSPNRWDVDKFDGATGAWLGTAVQHLNDGTASVGKGIAFGPDGDLYVGDWYDARIDRYEAGSFTLKASYLHVDGDNLGTPNYMTFAPDGRLMVVAGGFNRVLEFDTSGDGLSLLGTFAVIPGAQQPQDLAFGPNGNLFVTGGYTGGVTEFDGTTGAFIQDFVPQNGTLGNIGMRFDNHGRLLVATSGNDPHAYGVVAYDALTGDFLGDFIPYGSGGLSSPIYMSIKPVPEPATFALLLLAGTVLSFRRSRSA